MKELAHLYHAAPLHYVPSILACGALAAASTLRDAGIAPRRTADRRDRKLGLQAFVHFSPRPDTPLLRHKLEKGYPHALFVFDAARVLDCPGSAVLPYNAKSWRHREDYAPIREAAAREAAIAAYLGGRHPGLEVVVPGIAPLSWARRLAFVNDEERRMVEDVAARIGIAAGVPVVTEPSLFPGVNEYHAVTLTQIDAYFTTCASRGSLAPPPRIPFD